MTGAWLMSSDIWTDVMGAGVGLQPSSGRRRSTRVSCKPLEWWRNERKVYERKFHSALRTFLESLAHAHWCKEVQNTVMGLPLQ